jgi:hypothetical protein
VPQFPYTSAHISHRLTAVTKMSFFCLSDTSKSILVTTLTRGRNVCGTIQAGCSFRRSHERTARRERENRVFSDEPTH